MDLGLDSKCFFLFVTNESVLNFLSLSYVCCRECCADSFLAGIPWLPPSRVVMMPVLQVIEQQFDRHFLVPCGSGEIYNSYYCIA
jgi:hypothetical protein